MGTQLPLRKGAQFVYVASAIFLLPVWVYALVGSRLSLFMGDRYTKRFALCYETILMSVLSVLSVTLVYCGQAVGWIRMPLGMEVGLGPSDIVLDGDTAPPTERGTAAPTFRAMSIVAKRSPISSTAELLLRYASGQTDIQTR